jgi:Uma2 family endonuclease
MTAQPVVENPPALLKMTFEEYLDWLDEDKHAEWVNGEVIMHSPVSRMHNTVGSFLLSVFQAYTGIHQAGYIAYELFQMKIGPDLPARAPDILFVANENMHRLKDNYLDGPADLIVEIVSLESRARDRGDKFDEYERGGVREYWVLDGPRKRAEFHVLNSEGVFETVTVGEDGIYRSTVLTGFWIRVAWLWQEKPPTILDVLREWNAI